MRPLRRTVTSVRRRLVEGADRSGRHGRGRDHPAPPVAAPTSFRPFVSMLPRRQDRTVAVVAHRSLRNELDPWLTLFAEDRCHVIAADEAAEWRLDERNAVFHTAGTGGQIAWEVRLIGAVDVLVNLLPTHLLPSDLPDQQQMWRRLYLHLKPGGLYVLDRTAAPGPELAGALNGWLTALATSDDPESIGTASGLDAELLRSTSAAVVSRDLICIRKRGHHYLKLRDSETNRSLPAREPGVAIRELATEEARDVPSRAVITSHESSVPIGRLPETFTSPLLHLRHYTGRIAFAGSSLMYAEYSILPDSFRHHLARNYSNARITDVSNEFARIPAALQAKESLAGNYYQLDSTFSTHFGHFTTEVLSRLWGWDRAKAAIPDLKVIMRKHTKQLEPTFERQYFTAFGIDADDIVWTDRPVYLESVVSATPMWHNEEPFYAHPGLVDIWDRLARSLVDHGEAPRYDRIFISRSGQWDRRNCRNVRAVEDFFREAGFEIVYPETLSIARQAEVFAGASVIAGFGGSAMFNMMFAKNMKTAIILSHEAYTARNEHLYTSLLGSDVHYFWSTPDVPHPDRGWSEAAFYSDWEFDFGRNGEALRMVFESL